MFWRNLKLCTAVPSYWHKPRPKFEVKYAKFEFEFPEDLDTLKDKGGTRQSLVIERLTTLTFCHKNSHPHICLLLCNSHVKLNINFYNTIQNNINSWKVIQASSAHPTNINHPVINILMVPESKIRKRHYWLIFKLLQRHIGKLQCNGLVFCFIMTHERMHERHFASESVTWLDVVTLNAV